MIIYSDSKLQSGKSYGSLFAGVGGFDLGFETAGFDCMWQVEWDKYCQQVLEFHWPNVPKFEDVRNVSGYDLEPVDVISYGFPCQDLSIAGKQAGLDGDRSGLFFEAIRIIKEMRDATDGKFPKAVIAENVTGLLTADGGNAMGRCLDALAEAGALVSEWCVLDAQWFGVPQRRRRVFLASIFDTSVAGRCADEIFPLAQSGGGHFEKSIKKGENTTKDVEGSSRNLGAYRLLSFGEYSEDGSSSTLKARDYKDATDLVTFVKPTETENLTILSFDTNFGSNAAVHEDVSPTLKASQNSPSFFNGFGVRRLTPIECERLMGWPDNHTLKRADGKTTSDSQRFKMCGNGVVAPVAEWVAKQIMVLL